MQPNDANQQIDRAPQGRQNETERGAIQQIDRAQ
jgi:hypothetical protein